MQLIKDNWTSQDGEEFQKYLVTLGNPAKIEWTRRIINTAMPLLAIPTPQLREVAKQIGKGNYLSFLDLKLRYYYDNTAINGLLIEKIKPLEQRFPYLDEFAATADNWATCDLLTFGVNESNKAVWWQKAVEYTDSALPFVRRIGYDICFKLLDTTEYLERIFDLADKTTNETHYYVNMVVAWLIAECFTKHREPTLQYFKRNKLNSFTVNKAVQKCRDSFRITKEDKDMLLSFKRKEK